MYAVGRLGRHVDGGTVFAFQENATQNEKVAARSMQAHMAPGSLLLADMGYFSCPWFDALTRGGVLDANRLLNSGFIIRSEKISLHII